MKPGIKELAILKMKEHNKARYGKLNMLLMKQSYFNKQGQKGNSDVKIHLNLINLEINE